MEINFNQKSYSNILPKVGDVLIFETFSTTVFIVCGLTTGGYALIDLADGCQIFLEKHTIVDLMNQANSQWKIIHNCSLEVK